jgi:hypothetical protein
MNNFEKLRGMAKLIITGNTEPKSRKYRDIFPFCNEWSYVVESCVFSVDKDTLEHPCTG